MSTTREQSRRKLEVFLLIAVVLIGWYISRPHPPDGARQILHWAFAALAAWFLGAAAWSIITKPSRILLALGYLLSGTSMTLQFIGDLAPPAQASNLESLSLASMFIGFSLFWSDHRKHEPSPAP
ncbi:MAG: hypothetical protein ABI884_01390 [Gemmatimonadota bacterium]